MCARPGQALWWFLASEKVLMSETKGTDVCQARHCGGS